MTRLYHALAGSPLRQLHVMLRFNVQYQVALTSRLAALVALERLKVTIDEWEPITASVTPTSGWDKEVDDEADEKYAEHRAAIPSHTPPAGLASPVPVSPTSQPSTSSLDSLDLLVSLEVDPVEHFAALLTRCPAVTSIKLNMRSLSTHTNGQLLLSFLHCLAHIGLHCPLIERVTFALSLFGPAAGADVRVVGEEDVRGVVEKYVMPAHAFGCLRYVCEVVDASEVLSQEAAEYVRRRWMCNSGAVLVI